MEEKKRRGILYYYELAALIALEITLAFSAWGYIWLDYISITFVSLVVLAAAYLLGPWEGSVAGIIFGLTGMWKATIVTTEATYVDLMFSPVRSEKPMQSVLLCLVPRILLGFVAGLLYAKAKKAGSHRTLWVALATFGVQLLHILLVFGMMQWLFPEAGVKWWSPVSSWHTNGMQIEMMCSLIALVMLHYLCESAWVKDKIDKVREGVLASKYAKVIY